MLDVRRLVVLREVARHGSFSRAAVALAYTQPAISRQIAVLEGETGTTLLTRDARGVQLTDAGELLVRHADTILARLEDAEAELNELLGMQTGRLRLASLSSTAATIMPLAIAEFRTRLPQIVLSVSMTDPMGLAALLRSGELDLAVCNDADLGSLPDIETIHMFDEPILIALPREHHLAGRAQVTLPELAQERWMLGTATSCPDLGRFLHACHGAGFDPQIAFYHDDYTAILAFVAAGVGVAPIPEMVARGAPSNVHISTLNPATLTRPILAALPAGYRPGPVNAMIEVLQDVSARWAQSPDALAAA